jgi:hypothetical protein
MTVIIGITKPHYRRSLIVVTHFDWRISAKFQPNGFQLGQFAGDMRELLSRSMAAGNAKGRIVRWKSDVSQDR